MERAAAKDEEEGDVAGKRRRGRESAKGGAAD